MSDSRSSPDADAVAVAPLARETETPLPDGLIAADDWDGSTPLVNVPGMIAEIRRLQRENEALRAASSQRVVVAARLMNEAADEVNVRYIGGSPLRGQRFSAAIERLAEANAKLRAALAPTPTADHQE